MRVISCRLQNFASYEELDFNFENQGLVLIQGPTGAGKSTLCDAIPWCVFGRTAKNGGVDEIRSWGVKDNTKGIITLESNGTIINIMRLRGRVNDLCYCIGENTDIEWLRGKDLNDTQKLINSLLGLDCELYLSGSYFHEFSQTAQFFTLSAKNRRQICEQIVDLSLAKKLQLRTSEERKGLDKRRVEGLARINTLYSNLELLKRKQKEESVRADQWWANQANRLKSVKYQYDQFENNRTKVLHNKCNACGTELGPSHTVINDAPNPYSERLIELENEENPFDGSVNDYSVDIHTNKRRLITEEAALKSLMSDLLDIDVLVDVVSDFRGSLIENTIAHVERETNQLLTDHFDAEIRVAFSADEADKLEVAITKDGNEASYTQLSKGQRQLLKLSFAVAVMKAVENHHGVSFSQLWFDEALDGLDETFKAKAYRLLDELATTHESVFVVEHSEGLKAMFPASYSVALENGHSVICQN